jgi:hypothetical protein
MARFPFPRFSLPLLTLGMFWVAAASAQDASQPTPDVLAQAPTVIFTFDFPQSAPAHYSLRVTQDGRATYESTGKLTPEAEGDPFTYEFQLSDANRGRIFDLTARARYFESDVDYRKGRQANTGKKVLSYRDSTRQHEVVYNYSTHQEIQQLTHIFQGIALTMECARRLQYFHRYQRLAVEEELKRMEEMAQSNDVEELQSIAPVLREIADDKSVLNVTRVRAQRLLALGTPPAAIVQ